MNAVVVLSPEELEALLERAVRKAAPASAPVDSAPPEVLTRKQAAELLQVDQHQIPKLVAKGLPYSRLGTQWRFRRSEVLAWLSAQREGEGSSMPGGSQ